MPVDREISGLDRNFDKDEHPAKEFKGSGSHLRLTSQPKLVQACLPTVTQEIPVYIPELWRST